MAKQCNCAYFKSCGTKDRTCRTGLVNTYVELVCECSFYGCRTGLWTKLVQYAHACSFSSFSSASPGCMSNPDGTNLVLCTPTYMRLLASSASWANGCRPCGWGTEFLLALPSSPALQRNQVQSRCQSLYLLWQCPAVAREKFWIGEHPEDGKLHKVTLVNKNCGTFEHQRKVSQHRHWRPQSCQCAC